MNFFGKLGKYGQFTIEVKHIAKDDNDCGDKDTVYDTCVETCFQHTKKITENAVYMRTKAYFILKSVMFSLQFLVASKDNDNFNIIISSSCFAISC